MTYLTNKLKHKSYNPWFIRIIRSIGREWDNLWVVLTMCCIRCFIIMNKFDKLYIHLFCVLTDENSCKSMRTFLTLLLLSSLVSEETRPQIKENGREMPNCLTWEIGLKWCCQLMGLYVRCPFDAFINSHMSSRTAYLPLTRTAML